MTVPTLAIQPSSVKPQLAASICQALKTYPHYILINGYSAVEGTTPLMNLAKTIQATVFPQSYGLLPEKVSVTKVQINPQKATRNGGVTRYSRTHLPLPPHTDSSYMTQPHELVAFQCVVADDQGGETIMVPVETLLQQLDDTVIELLRDPVYPFGQATYPIISGDNHSPQIRYYRSQIDQMLGNASHLSPQHQAAIAKLDHLLNQTDLFDQFHLKTGQILLMHNHKVLHGRTGFSTHSDRLLYRVRLHLANLDACPKIADSQPVRCYVSTATDIVSQKPPELPSQPDIKSYLKAAYKLEKNHRFNEAFQQYQQVLMIAPDNPEVLDAYGHFLLQTGQFNEAIHIFRRSVTLDPNGYESQLALSSLAHHLGNPAEAHQALIEATTRHPYILWSEYKPHKPTILRLRSFEGSAYQILEKQDGTYHKLLRGGHFSIRDLVNKPQYNLVILNLFENNIDTVQKLPHFDIILNTIACPDSKRESLLTAARFLDSHPQIPVINHPRQVLDTTRERNSLRLNLIPGVEFPKTERLRWDGQSVDGIVKQILGLGFVFPMIVRKVGSQTGQTVALVHNETALRSHFETSSINQDYYVIQFKDCQHQRGVFNKTRIFFIDGEFYPVANLFNNAWNTHSGDRYNIMNQSPWMQTEEKAFLGNPYGYFGAENFKKFYQIRDIIGLDFFGIDFTILPDGTLFIFELNAAMRHNFDHAKNFPYTEPHLKRISRAFNTMVQKRLSR